MRNCGKYTHAHGTIPFNPIHFALILYSSQKKYCIAGKFGRQGLDLQMLYTSVFLASRAAALARGLINLAVFYLGGFDSKSSFRQIKTPARFFRYTVKIIALKHSCNAGIHKSLQALKV